MRGCKTPDVRRNVKTAENPRFPRGSGSVLGDPETGNGAQGRNRTTDTVIFSHVLYQLSYLGADLAESEDQGEREGYRGSFFACPGTEPERRRQMARPSSLRSSRPRPAAPPGLGAHPKIF